MRGESTSEDLARSVLSCREVARSFKREMSSGVGFRRSEFDINRNWTSAGPRRMADLDVEAIAFWKFGNVLRTVLAGRISL